MNTKWMNQTIAWIARVVGGLFTLMTAYGWWNESQARQVPTTFVANNSDWFFQWAIFTHFLPLLVIVAGLALGWKRPFWGMVGFAIYAVLQAFSVGSEWAYLPLVAGPPLLIAAIFATGWLEARRASS